MKKILMRMFFLLIFLIPGQAFAKPAECPLYSNKQECLKGVNKNYDDLLKYLDEEPEEKGRDDMIQAAVDIKYFESLACTKTCLN